MLKTVALSAALTLAALSATSAQAVTTIKIPVTLDDNTGGFLKTVAKTALFSYDFTFNLTQAGTLDVSTTAAAVKTPLLFTVVTLNGTPLVKDLASNTYALSTPLAVLAGLQTLHIEGKGGSAATTLSGSIQFTSLVPEPAAWGMMVIGFGALGATMRRRPAAGLAANA